MNHADRPSALRLYLPLTLFGIAFGYVEAAVVVYLRQIYYPGGFEFPLVMIPAGQVGVEIAREAATIVMLGAVAHLAGRTAWERFGHFAFLFGVWDIAFYAGLALAIGWPPSIMTWDILFLIPFVWTGPVLTPVLVSALIIASGAGIAARERRGRPITVSKIHWALGLVSIALLLYAFMANDAVAAAGGIPPSFPWIPFVAGLLLGAALAIDILRRP